MNRISLAIHRFRLWLKGRKTMPDKDSDGAVYESMNINRERYFYKGIGALIIVLIGVVFLLYPLFAYTPDGLRPNSMLDENAVVIFPKNSVWGWIYGNNFMEVTLNITDAPKINEIPGLNIADYSGRYQELTYSRLSELGVGHYKALTLSYFAWSIGQGQEIAWKAWEGIAVPLGMGIGNFGSAVFGETWDTLAENVITASWRMYFMSIMILTGAFAISFAIWFEPHRREATKKAKKWVFGPWVYDPNTKRKHKTLPIINVKIPTKETTPTTTWRNDHFNLLVKKAQPWATVYILLAILSYYVGYVERIFVATPILNEAIQAVFWVTLPLSGLVLYYTLWRGRRLRPYSGPGRPPKQKDLAKIQKSIQETRADRDIMASEASRGIFKGLSLSKFLSKDYTGTKDSNILAQRMLAEQTPITDPDGNPVRKQTIITPSGRQKLDYIKTKMKVGGTEQTYYFNTLEDKERFRENMKLSEKYIENIKKDQSQYNKLFGPIISSFKAQGYTQKQADDMVKLAMTQNKYKETSEMIDRLKKQGLSEQEAATTAYAALYDVDTIKQKKWYKEQMDYEDKGREKLKGEKQRILQELDEEKRKIADNIIRAQESNVYTDKKHIHNKSFRGTTDQNFLFTFFMSQDELHKDPENLKGSLLGRSSIDLKDNVVYLKGTDHDKIIIKPNVLKKIDAIAEQYKSNNAKLKNLNMDKKTFGNAIANEDLHTLAAMLKDYSEEAKSIINPKLKSNEANLLAAIFEKGQGSLGRTNRFVKEDTKGWNPYVGTKGVDHGVIRLQARTPKYKKDKYVVHKNQKPKKKKGKLGKIFRR